MRNADAVYRYLLEQIDDTQGVPIKLDTERTLSTRFGVSRGIARSALQRLVREGRAVSEPGRGYFIRPLSQHSTCSRATVGIVYVSGGGRGAVDPRSQEGQLALLVSEIENLGMRAELLPLQEPHDTASITRMVEESPADVYVLGSLPPACQDAFADHGKPAVAWGGTFEDLGFPNVGLNHFEIARELTEQLFSSGHRCVCLFQEFTRTFVMERSCLGFIYAHAAWRVRFKRERIIRVDRQQRGLRRAIKKLLMLSPSAMLVSGACLLERFWGRADEALQKKLAEMEIIVSHTEPSEILKHPAKIVEVDEKVMIRMIAEQLTDVLNGRPCRGRFCEIPWKLVSRP